MRLNKDRRNARVAIGNDRLAPDPVLGSDGLGRGERGEGTTEGDVGVVMENAFPTNLWMRSLTNKVLGLARWGVFMTYPTRYAYDHYAKCDA